MGTSDFPQWKKNLLEFAGAFAICFFGPATLLTVLLVPSVDEFSRRILTSLVPGVTLATCIATFAKYSGSHVNPAVTVTFTSAGSFRARHAALYFASQLGGALLAGFALLTIFGSRVPSAYLGSSQLGPGVTPVEGIVLEVLGTALFCSVILWVVALVRGSAKQGAIVGATLSVLIFVLGPVSGASLHPFKSLALALFSGHLEDLYVYLIGPTLGAALAGLVFRAIRSLR